MWPNKGNIKLELSSRPSSPALLEVTTQLGAQKITFVVEIRDAISIIPKEYLTNTILYPMNISLVSANNVKKKKKKSALNELCKPWQ